MAITRLVSGLWGGKKTGSFSGKTLSSGRPSHAAHDVISGLWGGKAHSSFAGKATGIGSPRPDHADHAVISGLWGGRAHSSFINKTSGVTVPDVYPGAGHPTGIYWGVRKVKKGKKLDDLVKNAMEQIIHGDVDIVPNTPVARAVEIIKPHIKTRKQDSIRPVSSIDWSAVEKDLKAVKELLRLWDEQMRIMDEEDILLLSEW